MRLIPICITALLLPVLLTAQGGEQKPTAQAVYDQLSTSLIKQATAYIAAREELQSSETYKTARKARDNKNLRALLNSLPTPDTLALGQKAIDASQNYEGDDAVKLLGWAAVKCRDTDMIKSVVATLEKDHIKSKGLIELLENASVISRPLGRAAADAFLTKVITESPHDLAKAWAMFWKSKATGGVAGQDLMDQAEKLGEGTWLADRIRAPRFKKQRLQIGMVAPNIVGEDIDGVKFELHDYRGKVTVLDFWGFRCRPCRIMIPHERSLVQRLKGKPFALIGVNSDTDKDYYYSEAKAMGVTWRSFWNGPRGTGGPISSKWGVSGWPTIYVLDHKGVIRFTGTRGPAMGEAVDQLLAEMETGK